MTNTKQIFLLSILCYGLQGLEKIYSQPFAFYLKNLGWTPSKLMYMGALISLAWLIKPLLGFLCDKFFNKKYWIVSSLFGSLILSIVLFFDLPIWLVLVCMFFTNWNAAIRDIALDGLATEISRDNDLAEKIQSVQWITITVACMLVSLCGGYIADHFKWNYSFGLLVPIYIFILWLIRNVTIGKSKPENVHISDLFKHKHFWWVCLFIFLWQYSPSFGSAMYFKQTDEFRWSQTFIGMLGAIGGGVSVLGAMAFNKWGHKLNLKKVIIYSTIMGAVTTLSYLYYTQISAIVYELLYAFIGMVIHLVLMTYMVKCSIKGLESVSFACLCSISNLAATASGLSGGFLLDKIGLNPLIILSSAASFLCLLVIPKIFPKNA